MLSAVPSEAWWPEIDSVLAGIPHAVIGRGAAAGWPDARRVHLVPIPRRWARAALWAPRRDPRTGVVTLPVGYVVLMKLAVSRLVDVADLTRVPGGRSDAELAEIRRIVRRFGGPDDPEDLEQLIALGRLERDDRP